MKITFPQPVTEFGLEIKWKLCISDAKMSSALTEMILQSRPCKAIIGEFNSLHQSNLPYTTSKIIMHLFLIVHSRVPRNMADGSRLINIVCH